MLMSRRPLSVNQHLHNTQLQQGSSATPHQRHKKGLIHSCLMVALGKRSTNERGYTMPLHRSIAQSVERNWGGDPVGASNAKRDIKGVKHVSSRHFADFKFSTNAERTKFEKVPRRCWNVFQITRTLPRRVGVRARRTFFISSRSTRSTILIHRIPDLHPSIPSSLPSGPILLPDTPSLSPPSFHLTHDPLLSRSHSPPPLSLHAFAAYFYLF